MSKHKPIVIFDFDGVIHSYTSGYKGEDVIPDSPVDGIKQAINNIRNSGYAVYVVSSRCATDKGMTAVSEWLHANGIEVDAVSREKPPAIVYIDDRAICFDGDAGALLDKIKHFKPWNKKERNT